MHLIVAATDGSEGSHRAIDMAAALAKASSAKLFVITVGDHYEHRGDIDKLAQTEGSLGEALNIVASAILHQAKQRAYQQGLLSVEGHQCAGDPAEEIMATALRLKANIIVVGRRGRGRIAGLLLGSISQKLVSLAPCAVMVVP